MDQQTELLRQIRDLLLVIAEPALAKRDERLRTALAEVVGKSQPRAKAIFLMNGSRNQAAIGKEAGIDRGNMSRFVKSLRSEGLLTDDQDLLNLRLTIPLDFFDDGEKTVD